MSNAINILQTERKGKGVKITDTTGYEFVCNNIPELLSKIHSQSFNLVWDSFEFMNPILSLIPKEKANQLADGKAVYVDGIRLWWGTTRHGRAIGIRGNTYEHVKGNIYNPTRKEIEISELKQYYDGEEKPKDKTTMLLAGQQLINTLSGMGLSPSSLISAASIYKECVLDAMPLPTIFNMPESTIECHELAFNAVDEWVATYQSYNGQGYYSYDLTAAYAWALSELPNLKYAEIIESKDIPKPGWYWGVMQGKVHSKTLKSPLISTETGRPFIGYQYGVITTDLMAALYQWALAEFEIEKGYFIYLDKYVKPLDYSMKRLYGFRGNDKLQNNLAKAMAVSVWGKMLETRETKNGVEYGELFNAIYGSMVVNAVKTRATDFVYSNGLQDKLLSVNVDGIKASKKLAINSLKRFGEWRLDNG